MKKYIDIGNEIKKELRNQERTVTWLASKLEHGDQSNLNKQLNSSQIKTDLLLEISFVLKKDLFIHYSQLLSQLTNNKV